MHCRALFITSLFFLAALGCDEETRPGCPAGTLDCPCAPADACGSVLGTDLVCELGTCVMPVCSAGIVGCRCKDNRCVEGAMCVSEGIRRICVPRDHCPAGTFGCPCYADESCDPAADGAAQRCAEGVCVRADCERGERGCRCAPGGVCHSAADICDDGLCAEDSGQTVTPPARPTCYTPCRDGLQLADGTYRQCSGEGLLEGCVGDALCIDGSCVTPQGAQAAPLMVTACSHDAACPDFQTCIQGRCYSDCDVDGDCRGDRVCHRKVCRLPCTGVGADCASGEHCKLLDGEAGFCFTTGLPRSSRGQATDDGSPPASVFSLDVETLRLSVAQDSGEVVIHNDGDADLQLTVIRERHTYFTDEGGTDVTDAPLSWLSITHSGTNDCGADAAPGCFIVPEGGTAVLTIADAAPETPENPAWARWTGRVSLVSSDAVSKSVALDFARVPEGRWSGSLVYLGDFKAGVWFEEWAAGRLDDFGAADNGLLRRWDALRTGAIQVDEFLAVLQAISRQSWLESAIKARCPDAGAPDANQGCYPYDGGLFGDTGIRVLSDDLSAAPIPSGPVDLPLEIVIGAGAEPQAWGGRVVSSVALHMPGDPAVALGFEADPGACPGDGVSCINYLTDLRIDIDTGGRFFAPDGDCALDPAVDGVTYDAVRRPWLVPLFEAGSEDEGDGSRARVSCRDGRFPGDPETQARENRSFTGANPYFDGRTLRRQVRLIAGAMIDQQTLFALVYEDVPALLDPYGQSRARAFGYVLLQRSVEVASAEDYVPGEPLAPVGPRPAPGLDAACPDELVHAVFGAPVELEGEALGRMVSALIDGELLPAVSAGLGPQDATKVHTLCTSTGRFDGGPTGREACPPQDVRWFTLRDVEDLSELDCQSSIATAEDTEYIAAPDAPCACTDDDYGPECERDDCERVDCIVGEYCAAKAARGTCARTFDEWVATGYQDVRRDPACYCKDDVNGPLQPTACDDPACVPLLGDGRPADLGVENAHLSFYDEDAVSLIGADADDGLHAHYLCHETGLINTGGGDVARTDRPCPASSRVTWFASTLTDAEMANLACQGTDGVCSPGEECARPLGENNGCPDDNPACVPGLDQASIQALCAASVTDDDLDRDARISTCIDEAVAFQQRGAVGEPCRVHSACATKGACAEQVDAWRASGAEGFAEIQAWRCTDGRAFCDRPADMLERDLRVGKAFVLPSAARQVLRPIDTDIEEAFQYKTRFRNRAGLSVGFSPEPCIDGQNAIPYCYDAGLIQAVGQRVDCVAAIYTQAHAALDDSTRGLAQDFLTRAFAYRQELVPGLATPYIHDGFERLYAELLVMLGDESITEAYASRFDLDGQKLADFVGSKFEPDGLDLSGKAGFELFSFYQGVQYFQLVMERFFGFADVLARSLDLSATGAGFIDQRTATSWLPRVLDAAKKKARAWAEIAERYVGFNQPTLARHVIERAFVETYLESLFILQVLDQIAAAGDGATRAQILVSKREAQLTFESSLRSMRSTYADILDEPNFFGVPNNFVPFPAVDPRDTNSREINAFDLALQAAQNKLAIAMDSEVSAIEQNREFETDGAEFQSEMAAIKRSYDNDLGALCGTFTTEDGAVWPAIPAYAGLSDATRAVADPCGLVGNGAIFEAVNELGKFEIEVDIVRRKQQTIYDSMGDLQARAEAQCGRIKDLARWRVQKGEEIVELERDIQQMEIAIEDLDRAIGYANDARDAFSCEVTGGLVFSTDCISSGIAYGAYAIGVAAVSVTQASLQIANVENQTLVGQTEVEIAEREILEECDALQIDTQFDIIELARQIPELTLEAQQAQIDIETQLGVIEGLYNDAQSTINNRAETETLRIAEEAARNDPNVRVYRNEAVITADNHFFLALKEAYKATRVFEYYTSQSYAARDELLLIRLAGQGDRSLQDYLIALEDSFLEFEHTYGNPDLRLLVLSLRDDIIPVLKGNTAVTEAERQADFAAYLKDTTKLDPRGYISLPFRTALDQPSPLTANHKIHSIEANLVGTDLGDDLGRVYVKQSGTATVLGVDGGKTAYVFPERTAVINTTFNGRRGDGQVAFDRGLYRNERFRDRPLVNTSWELFLNTRDERVNEDIDVSNLQDIVLYVYYTDFTTL